jgi:O-antigen/teichoic acid export membrane protein
MQLVDFVVGLTMAVVLVAALGRGIRGALEALAVAGVMNSIVCVIFVAKTMPGRLEPGVLREALRFSVPYVPHFVANQLLLITDRWVLKSFGFDEALGVYSLASQLAAPVTLLVLAWNEAVSPRLGEEFRAHGMKRLAELERSTVRGYVLLALAGSVVMIVAAPVLMLLLGKSYWAALWFLPGLCLVMIVESIYYPYSNVLFFANRTSTIPRITFVAGAVSVAANFALVPFFGVPGAIVSRLLGGGVRSVASALAARESLRAASVDQ